jgi:hypothetical protein
MNRKKRILITVVMILVGGIIAMVLLKKGTNNLGETPKKIEEEIPEVLEISTDFNVNEFDQGYEVKLLKELKICDSTMLEDNSLERPACSPRFFRFFPLKHNMPLNQGFILLVRSGVNGFPVRRLLIFERSNGKLVNTNRFIGYIIQKRKQENRYDDIVVRFFERYEKQKYFYHCLYTWENGKYVFVRCEKINGERIKPELIDSVSVEVQKILNEKNLVY